MTADGVDVAALDDLEDGEGTAFDVEGRRVSVVRLGDRVYVVGDTCSHEKVSLSGGIVDEGACTIECPKHGSEFDLLTGEALTLPAIRPIPTYSAQVVDGRVVIDVTTGGDPAAGRGVSS